MKRGREDMPASRSDILQHTGAAAGGDSFPGQVLAHACAAACSGPSRDELQKCDYRRRLTERIPLLSAVLLLGFFILLETPETLSIQG